MAGYRTYTPDELAEWLPRLRRDGKMNRFYTCHAWLHLRAEVLAEQHYECQRCRAKGRMTPATCVHHKKYISEFPALALSKENLEALCDECHYREHHPEEYPRWDDEMW